MYLCSGKEQHTQEVSFSCACLCDPTGRCRRALPFPPQRYEHQHRCGGGGSHSWCAWRGLAAGVERFCARCDPPDHDSLCACCACHACDVQTGRSRACFAERVRGRAPGKTACDALEGGDGRHISGTAAASWREHPTLHAPAQMKLPPSGSRETNRVRATPEAAKASKHPAGRACAHTTARASVVALYRSRSPGSRVTESILQPQHSTVALHDHNHERNIGAQGSGSAAGPVGLAVSNPSKKLSVAARSRGKE